MNLLVASTGMPKTSTFLSIEGEGESEMYSISNAVQNVGSGGEGVVGEKRVEEGKVGEMVY